MASHLYNSRLGKVAWFVRRFGAGELLKKPLRCAFAPLIIPRLAKREFVYGDKSLPLFYHGYNMTWANERAVEVPIGRDYLSCADGGRVLEVGNVLSHYGKITHTVLDKFEQGEGIINEDILAYSPAERFDLILSISTFEHIGFDDEAAGDSGEKIRRAIAACRALLADEGRLVLTVPLGYNPALDRMIADDQLQCDSSIFIRRSGALDWEPTSVDRALDCRYGSPFPYANAVMVAEFGRAAA